MSDATPPAQTRRRTLKTLGVGAGAIAVVGAGFFAGTLFDSRSAKQAKDLAADIPGFLWPNPPSLPEFELTDHDSKPFDRQRLEGRWSLFYFGYTFCPDACPLTLTLLSQLERQIEDDAELHRALQVVFVSVDPKRDKPVLADYVKHFSPRFVGATGGPEALTSLTRPLGIVYYLNEPDSNGDYLVDHASSLLLVDPNARLVGVFSAPHEVNDLADRLRRIHAVIA